MLVSSKQLLIKARRDGYAIGAFNFNNLEQLQAIINAAEAEKSPVIISTSQGAIEYASIEMLVSMAKTAARNIKVPVVLHLDHGKDPNIVKLAIKSGYSSVMFDGSALPYAQNISLTKQLVTLAHTKKIPLEAELGVLGGVEDMVKARESLFTDPVQVKDFVSRTGCDSIAVSIGTSHGVYKFKGQAFLDFERLRQIARVVNIPIVLHGASSVPVDLVSKAKKFGAKLDDPKGVDDSSILNAIKLGVAKINIDSDLRLAFMEAVRQELVESPKVFDPRQILTPARELMTEVARKKMRLFGSSGRG